MDRAIVVAEKEVESPGKGGDRPVHRVQRSQRSLDFRYLPETQLAGLQQPESNHVTHLQNVRDSSRRRASAILVDVRCSPRDRIEINRHEPQVVEVDLCLEDRHRWFFLFP